MASLAQGKSWVPLPGRQEGCLLTGKVEVGLSWAEELGGRFQGLEGAGGSQWAPAVPDCELALHWAVEEPRKDVK